MVVVVQEGAEVHMYRLTDIQHAEEGAIKRGLKSFTRCSSMYPVTRCCCGASNLRCDE